MRKGKRLQKALGDLLKRGADRDNVGKVEEALRAFSSTLPTDGHFSALGEGAGPDHEDGESSGEQSARPGTSAGQEEERVTLSSWNSDLVFNAVNLTLAAVSGLVDGEPVVEDADHLARLAFQSLHQLKKYENVDGSVVFNALPKYHDAEGRVALDYSSRLQPRPNRNFSQNQSGKGGGGKGSARQGDWTAGEDFSRTARGRRPDAAGQGNRFFNRGCFLCEGESHVKARCPVLLALSQGNMKWFGEKGAMYPDPHRCSVCKGRFHEKTCTASAPQAPPPEGGYADRAPVYNALSAGPANRAVADLFSRMAQGESVQCIQILERPLAGSASGLEDCLEQWRQSPVSAVTADSVYDLLVTAWRHVASDLPKFTLMQRGAPHFGGPVHSMMRSSLFDAGFFCDFGTFSGASVTPRDQKSSQQTVSLTTSKIRQRQNRFSLLGSR